MELLLEHISKNTSPKDSFYIVCRGNKSSLTCNFSPVLAGRNMEIAVVGLSTYYSYPNVNEKNNLMDIYVGKKKVPIEFEKGCYEIEEVNKIIHEHMGWKKKDKPGVNIAADEITLRTHMCIEDGYSVSFQDKNSIATLLGFKPGIYIHREKPYISQKIANILTVNSILVQCDVISGSTINGRSAPIIFNYSPNVSAGNKIVAEPVIPIYLPVTSEFIHNINIWITDQDNTLLDLQEEDIVITFHMRAR